MKSLAGTGVVYDSETQGGLILRGWKTTSGAPAATASVYAVGARIINTVSGIEYTNTGTSLLPVWQTAAVALTATADGLTTGLIPAGTKFVAATSAAATNALTLPAITADTIGQQIIINVGSNGYELLTPSASGNTINNVDSDGTNQLDVAATTNLICIQISATGWIAIQVAATTITVVAPDND